MNDKAIIFMDDHRQHVVIPTDIAQHVYPLSYFQDFVDGKRAVEPIPADVMRVIVREWLSYEVVGK